MAEMIIQLLDKTINLNYIDVSVFVHELLKLRRRLCWWQQL